MTTMESCLHCKGEHDQNDCPHWEGTSRKCIWHNRADNSYWFSDETERIYGNGPYNSVEEAENALIDYCKHL